MQACRWLLLPCLLALAHSVPAAESVPASAITWKKTVLDKTFRSEGIAVADVNKDGRTDILTGEVWYAAPDWKMHFIRKPARDYGDGLRGYSESFACWTDDFNGDGWPDLLVIRFPGNPCYWYENPQGGTGLWKEHLVHPTACNETPQYVDLFGTGKRVLVMGIQPDGKGDGNEGQMVWLAPGSDPTRPWEIHPISPPSAKGKPIPGTNRFSHGLGIGDLNSDGRLDVICTGGWWEQPANVTNEPWPFHPANLGEPCADMFAYDLDGDGKADVISSSAHKFGIWAYQQRGEQHGHPTFLRIDLFKDLVSETHALHCVDINGDGLKDLVTGKRWWSHGRSEPGADMPAMIYWFEARKGADGMIRFQPHAIDNDSGIGTQFVVADLNSDGLLDVATSNKKGTHLFEQQRGKTADPLPRSPEQETALFNGRDLSGWDSWLGRPYRGKEVVGLNIDPKQVYSVVTVDGAPAIRISGEIWGALTSKEAFENYHLRLEFKWGEKKWPPREKAVRDSGLLYHCVGPHGAHDTFWMQSLESQIQEGDCGDYWSVAGSMVDTTGEVRNGLLIYSPSGQRFTVPRRVGTSKEGRPLTDPRIVKSADYEKPHGEWNVMELLTVGDTAVHVVNGKPNLVLTNSRRLVDGREVPLTGGKIQLQSEGAEVFYRNIVIKPLRKIPEEYLR